MTVRKANTNEAGFTLLETLIALVILSGALLSFYSIFSQGMRAQHRAAQSSDLIEMARYVAQTSDVSFSATGQLVAQSGTMENDMIWSARLLSENRSPQGPVFAWLEIEVSDTADGRSVQLQKAVSYYGE